MRNSDAYPSSESGGNFFDMSKALRLFLKKVFKYYDHKILKI